MSDPQQPPPPPPPPPGAPPPLPPDLPHDSRKVNIIVSAAICWWIAAFFVGLRFYTRGVIIRVIGASDWSILLALVFGGATCGAVIEQAMNGAGQHVWDLDPTDFDSAIAWARAAWYGILFYLLSLCFSKLAILLLYLHLFTFRWARLAGQVLFGIVVVSHLYIVIATFTACIPLRSYWDFTVPKRYCHPPAVWWANTGIHMVTDFLIFLLPMPVVWTIQLPRRQKIILSGVFGFGFLVCFISILRLLQLLRSQTDPDFTYAAAELSYLTVVEVNGAVVCACVMTLKPFLARFFPRSIWGSSRRSASSGSGSGSGRTYYSGGYQSRYYRNRHRRYFRGRNRGSGGTLVAGRDGPGGPPTIGSLPSKLRGPLVSVDREVWAEGPAGDAPVPVHAPGKRAGGAVRKVWVDGGYVEIEDGDGGDVWGAADVELAEQVRAKPLGGLVVRPTPPLPPPPRAGRGGVRVDREFTVEVVKAEGG